MINFHVLHRCGWVGTGDRPPARERNTNMSNMLLPATLRTEEKACEKLTAKELRAFQEAMDAANKLPLGPLNGTPEPEDERTLTEQVRERTYADDHTSNLLIPEAWRE